MSVLWTLRKLVDSVQHREEAAQRRRDRTVARRIRAADDLDDAGAGPSSEATPLLTCRVCGFESTEEAYCPTCLADTMQQK